MKVPGLVLFLWMVWAGFSTLAAQDADSAQSRAKNLAGGSVSAAMEDLSPEDEYYIGRAVGAALLSNYRLYTANPNLTAYLNKITLALAVNSSQPQAYRAYRTAILDSNDISAFATPAGYIFVSRGLLSRISSEDAVAAVIAHELAHILLRHSIKAIRSSRLSQALQESAGTGEAAERTEDFDQSVNDIMTALVRQGYSHAQEFEADSVALSLLASAGYDPAALIETLRVLSQDHAAAGLRGFNSTHPAPDQRIANIERQLGRYRVRDTRSYRRARFRSVM